MGDSGGTTGIGAATAKLFQAEGATVIVTGRNPATVAAASCTYERKGPYAGDAVIRAGLRVL